MLSPVSGDIQVERLLENIDETSYMFNTLNLSIKKYLTEEGNPFQQLEY